MESIKNHRDDFEAIFEKACEYFTKGDFNRDGNLSRIEFNAAFNNYYRYL
jgi:hypothetical protein